MARRHVPGLKIIKNTGGRLYLARLDPPFSEPRNVEVGFAACHRPSELMEGQEVTRQTVLQAPEGKHQN